VTELIVAKDFTKVPVRKRGIVTVPGEMAKFACQGARLRDFPLPHRQLQLVFQDAAQRFISQQAKRGYEYWDRDSLLVWGPYPSYEFQKTALHGDEEALRKDDPRLAVPYAKKRAASIGEFADYLLVGTFVAVPVVVES